MSPSPDVTTSIIEEFRANEGRVGGPVDGTRLLLLTTTGARSGAPHTVPLGYLPDGGERILVIASAGGAPRHPAWFHNLVAHPRVTVEDGVFTYQAEAEVLRGPERDAAFARAVESDPEWARYQENTSRTIPVVALRELPGPPSWPSPGAGLRMVHDAFRRELDLVRAEVTSAGTGLGVQLRMNCLTLCAGLGAHHRLEDEHLFPALRARHPELGAVLDRLDEEHERIAAALTELRAVLDRTDLDRDELVERVDQLTGEVLGHLDYEEETLIPVLDAHLS
ncbi:nitroreductase family deazaflavin-dependent oxidoreductase [Actinoalloteichus sp. AHMU CJ021]|uniref:Deazaflavin-dependent oxidoreductase, nitroreductase family n=1 Tax=Actinoalloteichus caeruleus DSM 43889 TaxID=1120930 RepID=A0ABT1JD62_ACTCY|nr:MULTISPECIES: nitroreductase/quinone reductase family protein [Actinoalloteichus]AUS80978.1 nitroreductase family deazaflavin-dependent oxidoreductase [Actinoalloteichus sp. AHMU CJ021]MCP2330432.1 deazaflavin-dependent oxidoreductase, nitroreductase family [Actinoalloteichus caeruleus DSM 43889]